MNYTAINDMLVHTARWLDRAGLSQAADVVREYRVTDERSLDGVESLLRQIREETAERHRKLLREAKGRVCGKVAAAAVISDGTERLLDECQEAGLETFLVGEQAQRVCLGAAIIWAEAQGF